MSRETSQWLNLNTLIGFTEKRGNAWHYRAEDQGDESNHYPDAIPVEDVRRRLFGWTAIPVPVLFENPNAPGEHMEIPGREVWIRDDNLFPMGIFSKRYGGHQYQQWLLDNVANLLDDGLAVGSAGLLKGGAQAWVSIELPENVTTNSCGVAYRPNLLATTSFDGSLLTTYKPVVTIVVCDNTREMALREKSAAFKVKHTKHSALRIVDARQALGIVHTISAEFDTEVERLCNTTVTDTQWAAFLAAHIVIPETEGHGRSLALAKTNTMQRLWDTDTRVTPWRGTAWGVAQAVNTYRHHEGIVRNVSRAERNMANALTGVTGAEDAQALELLERVLS